MKEMVFKSRAGRNDMVRLLPCNQKDLLCSSICHWHIKTSDETISVIELSGIEFRPYAVLLALFYLEDGIYPNYVKKARINFDKYPKSTYPLIIWDVEHL